MPWPEGAFSTKAHHGWRPRQRARKPTVSKIKAEADKAGRKQTYPPACKDAFFCHESHGHEEARHDSQERPGTEGL